MVSAVESVRSLPLLYCASATLLTGELTYTGNRDHNRERTHASDSRTLCCAAGQLAAVDNWRPDFRRRGCVRPGFLQQWPRRTTGSHANRLRRLSNW